MTARIEFEVPQAADKRRVACASCNAPIWWIVTRAGQRMPLSCSTAVERDGKLFAQSHFADCPSANQHRRPK